MAKNNLPHPRPEGQKEPPAREDLADFLTQISNWTAYIKTEHANFDRLSRRQLVAELFARLDSLAVAIDWLRRRDDADDILTALAAGDNLGQIAIANAPAIFAQDRAEILADLDLDELPRCADNPRRFLSCAMDLRFNLEELI